MAALRWVALVVASAVISMAVAIAVRRMHARAVRSGRTVEVDGILRLEESGLVIDDQQLLMCQRTIRSHRRIYWPVTPSGAPNLIHAAFAWYLRHLSECGLRLTVFVFDSYCAALQRAGERVDRARLGAFVEGLESMGLREVDYEVVYQSELRSGARGLTEFTDLVQTYFSLLSPGDIADVPKANQHDLEKRSLLRFFKPVLNMVYLQSVERDFGFVLAGCDERQQWSAFRGVAEALGLVNPVKLYIPEMKSIDGGLTHVLDRSGNISLSDSRKAVLDKCRSALEHFGHGTPVEYVLEHVYFASGQALTVPRHGNSQSGDAVGSLTALGELLERAAPSQRPAITEAVAEAVVSVMRGQVPLRAH